MLAAVLGKEGLVGVIRAAVKRASTHGFTFIGPTRLFIELSFLFGSGFDADVQYPWAAESLGSGDPETQVGRAQTLFERSSEAIASIYGPEDGHAKSALRRLKAQISAPPPLRADDFAAAALAEMARVHPEKYAFVGEAALRSLIAAGEAAAAAHGLADPRDVQLIVLLMFTFGQGCLADPLYPWISRGLAAGGISTPSLRAGQLREKTIVWIRALTAKKEVRS